MRKLITSPESSSTMKVPSSAPGRATPTRAAAQLPVVEGERSGPVETALAEELLSRGTVEILRVFGRAHPVPES